MDEFEKIRAFSQEMSRQTEQAVAQEQAEVVSNPPQIMDPAPKSSDENLTFLEEWTADKQALPPEQKSLSKTFWLVLGFTTLVLGSLVVVLWLLMRTPMEKGEIVSISPTPTPVKVKPENPGGIVIPDQDKEIYTRLNQERAPIKVERLFDVEEEQPVLPPVVEEEPVLLPEIMEEKVEIETQVIPVKVAEPVKGVKPIKKQEKKAIPQEKTAKKSPVIKEKWRVQLFSSSDKAKVESTWNFILKKHKNLLSNMAMTVEKAEISGKGTFYRLKVGEFSTKERATTLCAKLKKQHQDCFPVK